MQENNQLGKALPKQKGYTLDIKDAFKNTNVYA